MRSTVEPEFAHEAIEAAAAVLGGELDGCVPMQKPTSTKRKRAEATDDTAGTLVITHAQCAQHKTHKLCPGISGCTYA